jgi:hypothetical protein
LLASSMPDRRNADRSIGGLKARSEMISAPAVAE